VKTPLRKTTALRRRPTAAKSADWPPAELALPDTIAAIEAGRPEPVKATTETPKDDNRTSRLARLFALTLAPNEVQR
jgi:hypothetical protein